MTDLIAFVVMLMLTGVFILLIAPVVMVLLWLNRKMMDTYTGHSQGPRETR